MAHAAIPSSVPWEGFDGREWPHAPTTKGRSIHAVRTHPSFAQLARMHNRRSPAIPASHRRATASPPARKKPAERPGGRRAFHARRSNTSTRSGAVSPPTSTSPSAAARRSPMGLSRCFRRDSARNSALARVGSPHSRVSSPMSSRLPDVSTTRSVAPPRSPRHPWAVYVRRSSRCEEGNDDSLLLEHRRDGPGAPIRVGWPTRQCAHVRMRARARARAREARPRRSFVP